MKDNKKGKTEVQVDENNPSLIVEGTLLELERLGHDSPFHQPSYLKSSDTSPENEKKFWYKAEQKGVVFYINSNSVVNIEELVLLNDSGVVNISFEDSSVKIVRLYAFGSLKISRTDLACQGFFVEGVNSRIMDSNVVVDPGSLILHDSWIRDSAFNAKKACLKNATVREFITRGIDELLVTRSHISGGPEDLNEEVLYSICINDQDTFKFNDCLLMDASGINITHRVHYGVFAGVGDVPFYRTQNKSINIAGEVFTKKQIDDMLRESFDVRDVRHCSQDFVRGLRTFTNMGLVSDNFGPLMKVYRDMYKDFLSAIQSRMDVFELISVAKGEQ